MGERKPNPNVWGDDADAVIANLLYFIPSHPNVTAPLYVHKIRGGNGAKDRWKVKTRLKIIQEGRELSTEVSSTRYYLEEAMWSLALHIERITGIRLEDVKV